MYTANGYLPCGGKAPTPYDCDYPPYEAKVKLCYKLHYKHNRLGSATVPLVITSFIPILLWYSIYFHNHDILQETCELQWPIPSLICTALWPVLAVPCNFLHYKTYLSLFINWRSKTNGNTVTWYQLIHDTLYQWKLDNMVKPGSNQSFDYNSI